MQEASPTSQVNLGSRIESLCIALKNLETDPLTSGATLRLLASIRSSCELHGLTALAEAAKKIEAAPPADLPRHLREFVAAMRTEMARQAVEHPTVLIVSADPALRDPLRQLLEQRDRQVMLCETVRQATAPINANRIAFLVVDLMLPGQDGRNLIVDLRSRPATAAMPIVAVGPQGSDAGSSTILVQEADRYFEKPADPVAIADHLTLKMKRGHAPGRQARRDPVTGLANRAAVCEAFTQAMAVPGGSASPSTLVIFGIDRFEALAKECGDTARDELLRQLGATLSASFRATDTIGRWGLSEFAAFLPGEDQYGATRALEKTLPLLNDRKVPASGGQEIPVTVCAGFTVLKGATSVEEAAAKAEQFLFEAFYAHAHNPNDARMFSEANQAVQRTVRIAVSLADANVARALKQLIEREKYDVRLLASPAEADALLAQERFHLLIVDCDLAGEGGFGILERTQGLFHANRPRTIALVSNEAAIVRALDLGANDYAVKPLAIAAFMSRVRRALWHEHTRGGNALTVMIVDHEVSQLVVAGTALYQRCGCRILLARNMADAVQRMSETMPDYLILDMDMPNATPKAMREQLPPLNGTEIVPAAGPGWDAATVRDVFTFRGRVTRPYKPVTLVEEFQRIASLEGRDEPAAPLRPEPIETEIQRILTVRR
jgi:diguanylate cyclase (GGDEF)-like protein